ncbi:MAG: 2-oxoacid:ferredoxin oxidoreductase subunit beta [Trueperaceae bacterium]|nr:2-oxoacid:ferredoxin oxidoreductase subunit beta [Trueperaceae bacterium]
MDRAQALRANAAGLAKADYLGNPSTLCKGCGHNSIANQIVQVAFELSLRPHEVLKLSGIGCSSKSPAYFLGMSHGFNALHGRMPSVSTGALLANHTLHAIGVSGDGDTGSIGLGQFKHLVRRNVRMVYLIENNGVYGLTKGQFSATADEGQELKYAGLNDYPAVDLCLEALAAGCGFVARSFAGNAKQVRELLKAALAHRGTAVLDIISPCVAFNNEDTSRKSYAFGRDHEHAMQDLGWIPPQEEIVIEPTEPGEARVVGLHDGSKLALRHLEAGYDPTNKRMAAERLLRAEVEGEFLTGLIYYDPSRPSLAETTHVGEAPLSSLPDEALRPTPEALASVLARY